MEEPLTNANQAINLGVPWLLPDGGMMTLTVFDGASQTLAQLAGQVEAVRQKVEKTDFNRLYMATVRPEMPFEPGEGPCLTLRAAQSLSPTSALSAGTRDNSACWKSCRPRYSPRASPLSRNGLEFTQTNPGKRSLAYGKSCPCAWFLTTGYWTSDT